MKACNFQHTRQEDLYTVTQKNRALATVKKTPDISQGSVATAGLRCGGIFNNNFITRIIN